MGVVGRAGRVRSGVSILRMLRRLVSLLPPAALRAAAALQRAVPALRPLFERLAASVAAGEGTIRHGPAAGLRLRADVPVAGYRLGTTEPDFQQAFVERVRPGDVVYDLGANVGFYTVLAARLVGPEGRVVAFEPFPGSAETVRHNARANGFETVTVVEAAIGEPGRAWLRTTDNPVVFRLAERVASAEGVEVEVTSVDTYVAAGGPPPDVIKVDVESAEVAALHGMARTLREHRPAVLVEVHHDVADFPDAVAAVAEPLGYRVTVLGGGPIPRGGDRAHVFLDPMDR